MPIIRGRAMNPHSFISGRALPIATWDRAMNLAPYSTVNQKNWLLAAMSSNDLALLEPMLKPVALKTRQVLERQTRRSSTAISSQADWPLSLPLAKIAIASKSASLVATASLGFRLFSGMTAHPMRPSFKLKALARASLRMICAKPCGKAHR